MKKSIRAVLSAVALSAALATTALGVAQPAAATQQKVWTPKAGKACGMSGTARLIQGKAYVCVSRTEGGKATWGVGMPVFKSALTIADGWAKAADSGMSAAFGMLKNPTDKPIHVVAAVSPDSTVLQLHEVVMKDGSMTMQQKIGGFVIPPKGMLELKPGGNHVMFMSLTKPITAGAMVPITFITSDGGMFTTKVLGKVFMGANESYNGGSTSDSGTSMSGM